MIKLEEARTFLTSGDRKTPLFNAGAVCIPVGRCFFAARVMSLSDDIVEIRTQDGLGGIRVRLSDADGFEYGEAKDAPPDAKEALPDSLRDSAVLIVGLPLRVHVPTMPRDKLLFLELPEDVEGV
jgi:hypothetical protein